MEDKFMEKLMLVERILTEMEARDMIWVGPLPLKEWCAVYGYEYPKSRNKMSKRFKEQAFRNKRISSQEYCVHLDDLPVGYSARVLLDGNIHELAKTLSGEDLEKAS